MLNSDTTSLIYHFGYQGANYGMEPIRQYVWCLLRAFATPSFEKISEKTENIFQKNLQGGNTQEFKEIISSQDFSLSNPYCSTKTSELAIRILLGAAVISIPIIGTGAIYLPFITEGIQDAFCLGILGQALHAGISLISPKNVTVIKPENSSPEVANCQSIASWNIGLVSVFAPLNVGTWESIISSHLVKTLFQDIGLSTSPSRLQIQAEVIKNLNKDVICFQEFFDPLQAKTLYNQVWEQYPYAYIDIAPHFWKGPSGLGVFSKIPLQNFQVNDFIVKGKGFDKGTNKKFVSFDVLIQGSLTRVYTAHLNCGDHPETRLAQLKEIKAHMEASKSKNCLILGDLNFDRNNPQAVDTAFYNTHFVDHLPPNITCSDTLKFKNSLAKIIELESIDYIGSLRLIETKNPTIHMNTEAFNVSDHLPVTTDF